MNSKRDESIIDQTIYGTVAHNQQDPDNNMYSTSWKFMMLSIS